ncbi:MAG: tetratricopeptide repeat protein, partial [Desulfobacterales bacterium]|nr:tetratricopeptide repeat protein [Desulfobacterales bacterium]
SLNPQNFAVQATKAEFYFARNQVSQAQTILDKIHEKRPDFLPAKILQGKIFTRTGKLNEAIEIFRTLVQDEPNSPSYNFLLGQALSQNGETAQANASIAKTIELNPNFIPARLLMAESMFKTGDFLLAETHINRVLDIQANHYGASLLLGNIRLATKEYDKAEALYKELIQANPKIPLAYYRLGIMYRIQRNYSQAQTWFGKALEIDPNLLDVFAAQVEVLSVQKKYDQALAFCDEHLKLTDQSPVVLSVTQNLKGNIYRSTRNNDKAQAAYEAAIQANPKYPPPYRSLAGIFMERGMKERAIDVYEKLSTNAPALPSPQSLIGTIYEQKKDFEKAVVHYQKALDIDPNHIPALNNLAFIYADQNRNLEKALDLARQARKLAGENPAIMDTLGWVYYQKALYDLAIEEFKACIQKDPQNPIFHYHLGLAYHKLGRRDQARTSLTRALDLQKDFQGAEAAWKILKEE